MFAGTGRKSVVLYKVLGGEVTVLEVFDVDVPASFSLL
jgi:hypothetical protein